MMKAVLAALVALVLLFVPDLQAQCAMCKTALTNSPEGRGLVPEFNRAILLMIAAPYVVFGAVGVAAFHHRIRSAMGRAVARLRGRRLPGLPPR